MTKKKLKVGWFSFTCCEDSAILFTELLNDHFDEWKEYFDFTHINILQKRRTLTDLDIAFIEGAISSKKEEEKVKEIRAQAKKVVAIGACACIGMPSSQRNTFGPKEKEEIWFLLDRFSYADNVRPIKDVITIDAQVPGCPMDEKKFLEVVDTLKKEMLP